MHIVRDLLQKNDWMTRINLKDAYFSIPIHPQHQKYLRFKEIISVHMSPFWDSLSSESTHKDHSFSGGISTQQRHTLHHLPGRYSPSGSGQDKADGAYSNNLVTFKLIFLGFIFDSIKKELSLDGCNS